STFVSPTTILTRSATRNHKLHRGIADSGASTVTFPLSTFGSYPSSRTSFATIASNPIALVAINVTVFVMLYSSLFHITLKLKKPTLQCMLSARFLQIILDQ